MAAAHGFALSGIALLPADGSAPRAAMLEEWLVRGLHGPLDYMLHSRSARVSLRERFPWARSVLALGAFYDAAERGQPGLDLQAHVARYARGRDYHRIFQKRLKRLAASLIEAGVCSRARYYTDTGPILERAWAEAAGLGWIGKNTCLIHPRAGSYFLLAEILMDSQPQSSGVGPASLPAGTEAGPATRDASGHCGSCRRCLDACPTQAFPAPGELDANRCLVTWNIEMRGETPRELWPLQGAWAAGCDICQSVCPYNAPERTARSELAASDPELSSPLPWQKRSLADCIRLTPAQFDRDFQASTLRRTGLKGLRLGAITAAGNCGARECFAALQECLRDADSDIRARAAWALERLRSSRD